MPLPLRIQDTAKQTRLQVMLRRNPQTRGYGRTPALVPRPSLPTLGHGRIVALTWGYGPLQ
jgi:hypothetical protein